MFLLSLLQLALLLAVFSIEAYVRLRLVRPMLRAKHVKTQMEEAAGNGNEVSNNFITAYHNMSTAFLLHYNNIEQYLKY